MMALSGTAQGRTGFYLNPSSNSVHYWTVRETGEWVESGFAEFHFEQYKDMETALRRLKGKVGEEEALVPVPETGTEEGGEGWYVNAMCKAGYYTVGEGGALVLKEE